MTCTTCFNTLRLTRTHEDGVCPVRASMWCSQCSCYGHRPAECEEAKHVWRPRTLEELIPADVRERWGIDTETPIIWNSPTYRPVSIEDAEREVAETNTIEVRYRDGKQDSRIREVMRHYKIPTVHKMDGNIQKLRAWAVSQGKKVRLVQEK
jgi:hypothetical protein